MAAVQGASDNLSSALSSALCSPTLPSICCAVLLASSSALVLRLSRKGGPTWRRYRPTCLLCNLLIDEIVMNRASIHWPWIAPGTGSPAAGRRGIVNQALERAARHGDAYYIQSTVESGAQASTNSGLANTSRRHSGPRSFITRSWVIDGVASQGGRCMMSTWSGAEGEQVRRRGGAEAWRCGGREDGEFGGSDGVGDRHSNRDGSTVGELGARPYCDQELPFSDGPDGEDAIMRAGGEASLRSSEVMVMS